jgi:hypothetical protein
MISKTKINVKYISQLVSRSQGYNKQIEQAFERKFKMAKAALVAEFDAHPVTKELSGGPNASNLSRTLPQGYGNLFSFIGFPISHDPISPVKNLLLATRKLKKFKNSISKNTITSNFTVTLPSRAAISSVSSMPWESGKSWVYAVESGISGFGYYMFKNYAPGRSKKGLQTDSQVRKGSFRALQGGYMTRILNNFNLNLNK